MSTMQVSEDHSTEFEIKLEHAMQVRYWRGFVRGWVVGTATTVFSIGFWALIVTGARAHQAPTGWEYPLNCCSNKDCAEISAEYVKEGPDGITITLPVGSHPMVTHWPVRYAVPYSDSKIKDSPDGVWHICLRQQMILQGGARLGGDLLCLFQPPRGF